MLPLLPNTDISHRDLWPLKEGHRILEEITDKDRQIHETDQGSWLVAVNGQWRLSSLKSNFSYNANAIRQQFVSLVKIQQSLEAISLHRCLTITENKEGGWRLWQIVKIEETLDQLLTRVYTEGNVKKIAAMLFIVVNKFFIAYQQFSTANVRLPLMLDNLTLHHDQVIFTGFVPTEMNPSPLKLESCIQQAFQHSIHDLSTNPKIKASLVSYYLSVHGYQHSTDTLLVNCLLKLFKS